MNDDAIEAKRLVFPGLAGLYNGFSPFAYSFMRFSTGAVLVPHGVQKFFFGGTAGTAAGIAQHCWPMPLFWAYAVGFVELVAAGCLALGLFTRLAAAMVWVEMLVVILIFNWQFGYFWTSRGVEYALLWLLLCTAIFFRGVGRYSLDALLGKEL